MSSGIVYPEKMEKNLKVSDLLCRDMRQRKARFNCINGQSFTTGQEIRIPISCNGSLQAGSTVFYGSVNVGVLTNASAAIDFSVVSLFDTIRVEAGQGGGSLALELCDDPGVFYSFLCQNTWNQTDLITNNVKMLSPTAIDTSGTITKTGATLAAAGTVVPFAIDLSQFMGMFQQNIPLNGTNGICLVLRVAPLGTAITRTGSVAPTTFVIGGASNPCYVLTTILEGEKYNADINAMKKSNGEVSIMFNTYSRYIQSLAGGSAVSNAQLLVSDNAKSVLGYFAIARATADITDISGYKNATSAFPTYVNHAVSVGGVLYPQNPVSSPIEAYEEALDLFRVISRKPTNAGVLNNSQGVVSTAYSNSATSPSAVLAVNLTKCSTENWGAGLNTTGAQSLYMQVSYTPVTSTTCHIFALRQQKVHIDAMGNFTVEK